MAEKLVIIGSGPAGWTCAIYAGRANLSPLVYEGAISEENRLRGTLPLGQLNLTTEVENFPGFPKGILGPELMIHMREQSERVGAKIVTEDIVDVDLSRRPFRLKDCAGEEATYLTKFASTVHLIYRKTRDKMRASQIMAERLLSNPKVKPIWNSIVDEVLGDGERGMTAVRVKNLVSGERQTIEAPGMFVAIGHTPNTKFLRGQLKTDSQGFIVLRDPARTTTSIEGVFAAGDVADPIYKQAITAAGMGCKAALDAERWLEAQHTHNPAEPVKSQWNAG